MLFRVRWLLAAMVVIALQVTTVRAEIYVFGDSLSETGNFYAVTGGELPPAPLYFDGRLSNGKAWVEYFATAVREPVPTPSLLGGSNFAFNGSRAAGPSPYGTPDLSAQVSSYLLATGGIANPDDIFIVWAGANDIFFGTSFGESDYIPNAINGIRLSIEMLYDAGARDIVVLDLPPIGDTPFYNIFPPASAQLNAASYQFNSELASLIRSLRHELPNVKIADARISRLFKTVARAPRLFGLKNVTDSATNFDPLTGIAYETIPGVNASRYLFWDSVHPTTKGHKIIASYVVVDYKLNCLRR